MGPKVWSLPHAACPNTPINYTAALRAAPPAPPPAPHLTSVASRLPLDKRRRCLLLACPMRMFWPKFSVLRPFQRASLSLPSSSLSFSASALPPPYCFSSFSCCCCPCQRHMLHVLQASLSTVAFLCAVISVCSKCGY